MPRVVSFSHLPAHLNTGLSINRDELVMVAVAGQIAHPVAGAAPYRIGNDGVPRVLPSTGGIVLNHRIGDRCVGLAGDHIEPGVALHNNGREVTGPRNGPNNALITYACVGNLAEVMTGRCRGARGLVTGKHGGVNHVLVDFPLEILAGLDIGNRIKIYSYGLGLAITGAPDVTVLNCAPSLLANWAVRIRDHALEVRVTHIVPGRVMGSGLGKNTAWRGDCDMQLFDAGTRRRHGLDTLRFGDLVAIRDADMRHGPSYRHGWLTVGIVVHGDSTVSGHGPGVTALLTGPRSAFRVIRDQNANLAALYRVRQPVSPRAYQPLAHRPGPSWRGAPDRSIAGRSPRKHVLQ